MEFLLGKLNLSGYVQEQKCSSCNFSINNFTVSADTNMVFDDVVSFVTEKQNEIVITNLTNDEFNNWKKNPYSKVAARVNSQLKRTDLFHLDKKMFSVDGKEIYSGICPKCGNRMVAGNKKTMVEFVEDGGRINCFETDHTFKME